MINIKGREGSTKVDFHSWVASSVHHWSSTMVFVRQAWKLDRRTTLLHRDIDSRSVGVVLGGRCHHLNSSTICKQVHSKFLTLALFANKSIHVHTLWRWQCLDENEIITIWPSPGEYLGCVWVWLMVMHACLVDGHEWVHLYFVGYGHLIFYLICIDRMTKFLIWLEGYSMDGICQKLVGHICHI